EQEDPLELPTPGNDDADFHLSTDSDGTSDSDSEPENHTTTAGDAMDVDADAPLQLDDAVFLKSMMKLLRIDETLLKPVPSGGTPASGNKAKSAGDLSGRKQQHTVPKAPPANFDASNLLLRPVVAATKMHLVGLDSDEDAGDLEGGRGVGIVGNRRGVQVEEGDSEDEEGEVRGWDYAFLKGLEGVEREIGERRGRVDVGGGEEGGRVVDSDDESSDGEVGGMGLKEYMEAMDLELAGSQVGGGGKKKGEERP
ncbi:hypothetical protein HDU98_006147, partial [Podochytrium sp. JEL0797]